MLLSPGDDVVTHQNVKDCLLKWIPGVDSVLGVEYVGSNRLTLDVRKTDCQRRRTLKILRCNFLTPTREKTVIYLTAANGLQP